MLLASRPLNSPRLCFFTVVVLSLLSAVVLPWAGYQGAAAAQQLIAISLNVILGAVALYIAARHCVCEQLSITAIVGLALMLRLVAIASEPLLEDDHFRYLWDAYQTQVHGSPYQHSPADFFPGEQLSPRWQDILNEINNPDLKTLYGPVLQRVFVLSYWIAPGELLPLQSLLLIIDLILLLILYLCQVPKRWLLIYTIHPLVLQEALASAHPDLLLGSLLLLAFVFKERQWPILMGAILAVALATKIAALVVVPLFLIERSRRSSSFLKINWQWLFVSFLSMAIVVVLLYLPVILSGVSEWETLLVFGNEWRFNPLLFRILDEYIAVGWARELSAALLIVSCGLLVALYLWYSDYVRRVPILLMLLFLIGLSPVVNPWYWLWLLPLAIYLQRWRIVVMACLAPISYWNTYVLSEASFWGQQAAANQFLVPWPITMVQVSALCWVIWGEVRWLKRERSV